MSDIIEAEIDPETGLDVEAQPEKLQEMIGQWQALNRIGMYFALTRRAITITADVPNEDALFEALHGMWGLAKDYPDVWPVTSVEELPALLQRAGVGG